MRADVFKLVLNVQWFSGMPATVKPNNECKTTKRKEKEKRLKKRYQ